MSSKVSASPTAYTGKLPSLDAVERYSDLEQQVFRSLANHPTGTRFFTTDLSTDTQVFGQIETTRLWSAYIGNIPADRRQYYNCRCCFNFINRFGGLVTINERGEQKPALWNLTDPPPFFTPAVEALYLITKRAKVNGVFLSSDKILGNPLTSVEKDYSKFGGGIEKVDWSHLSANNPDPYVGSVLSASQAMAEKVEDYKMVCQALADYSRDVVGQAARALRSGTLYRSEKATEIAEWFYRLHCYIRDYGKKTNLAWLVVALAPPGFTHIRSGMIGTLLDDIKSGLEFSAIAARWKEKMNPTQYQRPTAPPKAGAIDQAEKLFATMGLERSLLRRFATLDDVQAKLWVPRTGVVEAQVKNGIFSHLRAEKMTKQLDLPDVTMTWVKFVREVLASVYEMEIFVESGRIGLCGLLTAEDPNAPPILQWDGLEGFPRNPVSHYFYVHGSLASNWGLQTGWNKVTCVFNNPAHWQLPDGFKHQQKRVHFAIDGCQDLNACVLGLFPENLKAELHSVRSVIEAHSNSQKPSGALYGTANGLTLDAKNSVRLRVRTPEGYANYLIDRLD
jgi:hypothetical protein